MVSELDDHLDVCVRGALEFLDQILSVALVGLYAEFVSGDDGAELLLCGCDVSEHRVVCVEFYGGRVGQGGAHGRVVEVETVIDD